MIYHNHHIPKFYTNWLITLILKYLNTKFNYCVPFTVGLVAVCIPTVNLLLSVNIPHNYPIRFKLLYENFSKL